MENPNAPTAVVCKELLGDIVATKTQFVIQNRLKAGGEWGDYSYRKTAKDAIEAARRESKWDDDHDMTSCEYRAVIRITSDHVLSPNRRIQQLAPMKPSAFTQDAPREFAAMTGSAFMWGWSTGCLSVLIPKSNGKGWLKVPASHHADERTSELQTVSRCNVCGLDGTLDFDVPTSISTYPEKRMAFEALVFPVIEKHYRCVRGREVGYGAIVDLMQNVALCESAGREKASDLRETGCAPSDSHQQVVGESDQR